jgi:hypothetical protein
MKTPELKSAGHNRAAAPLRDGLEKSLAAYATAAAAGAGLMAALPAEARIVYTPAKITIPVYEWVPIDLNHDGVADFSFYNYVNRGEYNRYTLKARAQNQANEIRGRGISSGLGFASALRAGFRVGTNRTYFHEAPGWLMCNWVDVNRDSYTRGQWMYTKNRYLGLKFTIGGQVHYGWARLSAALQHGKFGIQVTLTGYAYETIPDKPIITGKTKGPDVVTLEPATLGRLAQGASGMSAWREKK